MKTMKTIIVTLALVSLCNGLYAGDSTDTAPNPRYGGNGNGYGLMALGGVTLTIGGLATRPDRYLAPGGVWLDKPFHKQGPRASAIVCGVTLTITGLISAIVNN